MTTKAKKCPVCTGTKVVKRGMEDGVQSYWCKGCNHRFRSKRKGSKQLVNTLWKDYVFHKQTLRELSVSYNLDIRTIHKRLQLFVDTPKVHNPRPVHLVVDGTYFGSRSQGTEYCVIVFRDPHKQENLWFEFSLHENTESYRRGRIFLEHAGYTILSVTGDGFSGIRSVFKDVPFQMCLVHMRRLVVQGTTRKPQLEAGQVLLALVKTLHDRNTTQAIFKERLLHYKDKYFDFLQEQAQSLETGKRWYVHDKLRDSFRSLYSLFPYLFTYKLHKDISPTTNSIEGHFRHLKEVVAIHCGTSKAVQQKIISSILLASSIAPKNTPKK
jgi:Transposase IS66 family